MTRREGEVTIKGSIAYAPQNPFLPPFAKISCRMNTTEHSITWSSKLVLLLRKWERRVRFLAVVSLLSKKTTTSSLTKNRLLPSLRNFDTKQASPNSSLPLFTPLATPSHTKSTVALSTSLPNRIKGVVAGSKYAVCQYKVARDRLPSAIAITPGPGHRLSALRQMNIRGMRDLNRGMRMLSGSVSGGVPIATGPGAGAGLSMWDLRDHLEGSSGVKLMTLTLDGAREHLCPLFVPSLRSFDLK
ncbi:uncharacterized protein C8R40DRAFT_1176257 [Lentinula edodes]|uniref:uncharacterized protein n=1 Tax=Lentinula edodes TaxID=5353 RepID=UPI001E8DDB61|nr:uncharacterized protein C8R40DRAFT_1176257 [Lentinula edodes]KAH7869933.1 hypothetical protein C8R40DRAFT_1176257 [Lentinula edodes]